EGGIFRAPLQAAIKMPGRFGPSPQLETDDRGTIVAPERVGTTGQNAVIMLQSRLGLAFQLRGHAQQVVFEPRRLGRSPRQALRRGVWFRRQRDLLLSLRVGRSALAQPGMQPPAQGLEGLKRR